jgi:NADPH:quinone reductase-like Zn-dependent oxidoreductase
MRAIVWTAYGPPDVLQLQEVEKPTPGDDELLIRIHATTVTMGDSETRSLKMPMGLGYLMRAYTGLSRPQRILIIGQEFAGEVESVGKDVTRFQPGDRIFGGLGLGPGSYAEYTVIPEEPEDAPIAKIPANLSYEEATSLPLGGLESLHFLGKAGIQPDQKVLVNGAGGSIGTAAVQLAKLSGAEVTAVDSAEKHDMLRSIGADHTIDYRSEDFTRSGETYDVVFDVIGKSPYSGSLRALEPGGYYLLANPTFGKVLRAPFTRMIGDKKVVGGTSSSTTRDLEYLAELAAAGELRPVIDRRFPLEEVAEAHRYVESGAKQGNVVITVD